MLCKRWYDSFYSLSHYVKSLEGSLKSSNYIGKYKGSEWVTLISERCYCTEGKAIKDLKKVNRLSSEGTAYPE